jgi:hypothetical protein
LHNSVLPHSAHGGRTPDEVDFGKAVDVPDELAAARQKARESRLRANRERDCSDCAIGIVAA